MRKWTILDPFKQPQGPYSEEELTDLVVNHGDFYATGPDCEGWLLASDLLERLAHSSSEKNKPTGRDMTGLDDDAQPLVTNYNAQRRADRDVSELLGLAKGLIADSELRDSEVAALQEWLSSHADACGLWPVNVLSRRLRRILADGLIEGEERAELMDMLRQVTGERPDASTAMHGATRFCFDDPPPVLRFHDRVYVFTGKFVFGTRKDCEQAVAERLYGDRKSVV